MTSDEQQGFTIRRIVVAVDSSPQASAALEAAASLAERLHAELEAIFVEDVNLVRLAELRIGREIRLSSGQARDFTTVELQEQFYEQQTIVRQAIATAAGRAKVTYSFRVARGQVETEILAAAEGGDLLILGMANRPLWRLERPGRVARAAAERAPRSVLISKPGRRVTGNALVCYDGSAGSTRALRAAVGIAGGREERLTVLIVAPDLDRAAALRAEVERLLEPIGVKPRFLNSPDPTPAQMCGYAAEAGADVLVISADDARIAGEGQLRLLESVACPVLLVR